MNNSQRGFTLIEIVVGIVVLSISLTIVTSIFLPQANKMTSPMYQVKASALGKSIMNQVLIRYYDELNVSSGSFIPCTTCTPAKDYGTDIGEDKDFPNGNSSFNSFNDVDDYHAYCATNPQTTLELFTTEYPGYGIRICVTLAADKFIPSIPVNTSNNVAKRIELTVFMPNDETITFTSFKGNY